MVSLVRSQFARDAFFDGMKAAGLLTTEEISELNSGDPTKLMDSSMYKFVMTYMFIRPSTTMLRNLEKQGGIDLSDDRSQLAPHEAQDLIEKLKTGGLVCLNSVRPMMLVTGCRLILNISKETLL